MRAPACESEERERETERERARERERWIERERDRARDRESEIEKERERVCEARRSNLRGRHARGGRGDAHPCLRERDRETYGG